MKNIIKKLLLCVISSLSILLLLVQNVFADVAWDPVYSYPSSSILSDKIWMAIIAAIIILVIMVAILIGKAVKKSKSNKDKQTPNNDDNEIKG